MQLARGIPLGRPFGVPLSAHTSWFPAAALLVAVLSVTSFGHHDPAPALGLAVATVVGSFVSVLLHELVHVAAARVSGRHPVDTTLYPIGGIARLSTGRAGADVAYALAGPATSGALAALCWTGSSAAPDLVGEVLAALAVLNAGLAVLNLIPAYPLDAWRILVAAGGGRRGGYGPTAAAAGAGHALGAVLVVVGVAIAALRWPSARLGEGLAVALVGVFVLVPASTARRGARLAGALQGRTVGEWAQPFAGRVPLDGPVPSGTGPFAVAEDGRLAGVLLEGRGGRPVSEAMVPWRNDLSCLVDDPLSAAVERIATSGAGLLVVLDAQGTVRGVLSEDEVLRKLSARSR